MMMLIIYDTILMVFTVFLNMINSRVISTWNVRTLKRPGKLQEVGKKLDKYQVKTAAIQETRWKGQGMIVLGEHLMMYSSGNTGLYATAFLLHRSMKANVIGFPVVSDRMCSLRIRAKIFCVTIVNVYALMEEADEDAKDNFMPNWKKKLVKFKGTM
ncbi:craniofacial development protein 2-like [Schistocerca americana]|uniref:craniofacial development protein 2-like n=1 Tax=Schistocerca americana TaxID=7009 RepID=UPI001F4FB920|nr:craniofacial development protein 2-like [Schistocerca americana]